MRHAHFAVLPLALAAALLSPSASHAVSRDLDATISTEGVASLRLVLPVGEVEVRGDGGTELRAELSVQCRRTSACADKIEQVHLDSTRRGDRLIFAVRGYPAFFNSENMHINGVVHVPAGLPLDIDMKVGDLRVTDVGSDVRVDMGVGEVRVNVPADGIRRVHLDSGVGDVNLRSPSGRFEARRSMLIGAKLDWREGHGAALVDVDLGVGEVTVDLD